VRPIDLRLLTRLRLEANHRLGRGTQASNKCPKLRDTARVASGPAFGEQSSATQPGKFGEPRFDERGVFLKLRRARGPWGVPRLNRLDRLVE
jgi:hypothetical protein